MTPAVDVYLSAAREDAAVAKELADALMASGISCFAGTSDRSAAEALPALENGRAVVFVLSAAANASSDVVRDLERAAGRGVPILTYAIEEVAASASIAYFTEMIPAIPAWSGGDRQQPIRTLVEAARHALLESSAVSSSVVPRRSRYSRATYREARGLQIAVALALAIGACLNAYVLYRDTVFLVGRFLGRPNTSVASAADYFGSMTLISALGGWAVLVSVILVLRRARLNLLSSFADVRVSAGEILWRPFVPFANAIWLPRMANALRTATSLDDEHELRNWPLGRYWGIAFAVTYSIGGARDGLLSAAPQSVVPIVALSVLLDAFQIVIAWLTYRFLSEVLDSVRAQRRSQQVPRAASSVTETSPALSEASAAERDVLIVFEPDDVSIAGNVGKVLEEFRCRCWTANPQAGGGPMSAEHLGGFDAILVVVSRASHSSQSIVELVQGALAGPASVLPFVVEAPPTGSALGHYIRSLHWIDGAAGAAALRAERVQAALDVRRVHRSASVAAAVAVDQGLFSRLHGMAAIDGRYRAVGGLRMTARIFAAAQIVVAAALGLIAFAIALTPQNAEPLTAFGISLVLVVASFPAWCAFLLWLWVMDRNARLLKLPGLESRTWLLCQVAVPGVSLTMGGRALGRLQKAISYAVDSERAWRDPVRRLRVTWTATGLVWTAAFLAAWELGARGWLVTAMLISVVQCVAACVRGAQRLRVIREIGSRLDARVRPWLTAERAV